LKCDGTRAETRLRLSAKRTSPFKSAGASVQLTSGSRGVRISGANARYTMFRGCVKSTGYPFHSPVCPSLPLPCVTVCHHISTGLYNGRFGFGFQAHERDFFLVLKVSTQVWGPHSLVCSGYKELFPWGWMGPGLRLTTYSHIIPRLRVGGTLSVLPHRPSWLAPGHLYLKSSIYTPRPHTHHLFILEVRHLGCQCSGLRSCAHFVLRS